MLTVSLMLQTRANESQENCAAKVFAMRSSHQIFVSLALTLIYSIL